MENFPLESNISHSFLLLLYIVYTLYTAFFDHRLHGNYIESTIISKIIHNWIKLLCLAELLSKYCKISCFQHENHCEIVKRLGEGMIRLMGSASNPGQTNTGHSKHCTGQNKHWT